MHSSKNQSARSEKDSVDRRSGGGGSKEEKRTKQHQVDSISSMPSIPKKHGNPGQVPPSVEAEKKEKGKGKGKEKYVSVDLSGSSLGGSGKGNGNGTGGNATGNGSVKGGESIFANNNNNKNKRPAGEDEYEQEKSRKKIRLNEPPLAPLPLPIPNPKRDPNPFIRKDPNNEVELFPIPTDINQGDVMFFYHTALRAINALLDQEIQRAMDKVFPPPDESFFKELAKPMGNEDQQKNPENPQDGKEQKVPGDDPLKWELSTKIKFIEHPKYKDYFRAFCSGWRGYNKFVNLLKDIREDRNAAAHEICRGNFYSCRVVSIFLNVICLQNVFGKALLPLVEQKNEAFFHHLLYKCAIGRDLKAEMKLLEDERQRFLEGKIASVDEQVAKVEARLEINEDVMKNLIRLKEEHSKHLKELKEEHSNRFKELKEEHSKEMKEMKEEHRGQIAELQRKTEEQVNSLGASLDKKITSLSTTNELLLAQLTQLNATMASNKTPKAE